MEKQFEKAVAAQCPEWINMIPVGVRRVARRRRGRLSNRPGAPLRRGDYEFLELKLGKDCDTPLHAAIEILGYGLLYLFSRKHRDRLGYDPWNVPVSATRIRLRVVAPMASYSLGSLLASQEEVHRVLVDLVFAKFSGCLEMD